MSDADDLDFALYMRNDLYERDPYLKAYDSCIENRGRRVRELLKKYSRDSSLSKGINNHLYYGLHENEDGSWTFREWAPNAKKIYLIGDFNNWQKSENYSLSSLSGGNWELLLPKDMIHVGDLYKLYIEWEEGSGERLPSYLRVAVQDEKTKLFAAKVCAKSSYIWKHDRLLKREHPLIYECHIGMSGEEEKVSTFNDFRLNVLPRISNLSYDTLQIMALQEHPYYGSFGYQVSNFFALSSRFGTPDDFKALVDEAHRRNIAVIMDIVHSHSVSNEAEGLSFFDGRNDLYFHHTVDKGCHPAWGSRCFDYGKDESKYFLLSNCKYWLEEYHLDGFRFDGVTSMLYWDRGLERDFVGYDSYFDAGVDESAIDYLTLANILIKEIKPEAITIAEDMSGMPLLAYPVEQGGVGFDFRMAMGIADHWIKWIKELSDQQWNMGEIWWELTNKRAEEKTVSYAECHDQALVGDKTLIFRLMDKEMYTSMNVDSRNLVVDRGMALIKMIRLLTISTSGGAYLNFMGNEFGHPEWIDFPREGNSWSYKYARRQWSLAEPDYLRYKYLNDFDKEMITLAKQSAYLSDPAELIYADEEKQILLFKRKNLVFAFNFNPQMSFSDYGFKAEVGEYRIVLNSDSGCFNGFNRIDESVHHFTLKIEEKSDINYGKDILYLYLPSRTALVLENINRRETIK